MHKNKINILRQIKAMAPAIPAITSTAKIGNTIESIRPVLSVWPLAVVVVDCDWIVETIEPTEGVVVTMHWPLTKSRPFGHKQLNEPIVFWHVKLPQTAVLKAHSFISVQLIVWLVSPATFNLQKKFNFFSTLKRFFKLKPWLWKPSAQLHV